VRERQRPHRRDTRNAYGRQRRSASEIADRMDNITSEQRACHRSSYARSSRIWPDPAEQLPLPGWRLCLPGRRRGSCRRRMEGSKRHTPTASSSVHARVPPAPGSSHDRMLPRTWHRGAFTDHGRVFGVYILLGRKAPATLADQAREVLATLTVT